MSFPTQSPGPPSQDIDLYQDQLLKIGRRLDAATRLLAGNPTDDDVEHAALHLRFVLELIVLSSLVTNRRALETVGAALHKKDADGARKLVKRYNADYWPVPVRTEATVPPRLVDVEEGFLREDEWGAALGTTSEVLHAANPLGKPQDYKAASARLRGLLGRIELLLRQHQLRLSDKEMVIGVVDIPAKQAQASGWAAAAVQPPKLRP